MAKLSRDQCGAWPWGNRMGNYVQSLGRRIDCASDSRNYQGVHNRDSPASAFSIVKCLHEISSDYQFCRIVLCPRGSIRNQISYVFNEVRRSAIRRLRVPPMIALSSRKVLKALDTSRIVLIEMKLLMLLNSLIMLIH